MGEPDKIKISIVILTYNGGRYLNQCLSMIYRQKIESEFEVICVDSGSKDDTIGIIRRYPVILFEIDKTNFNHGLTRNFAISKASGEFVILISQDAIPYDESWMKALIKCLEEDNKIAGVYCRQIPRDDADAITKRDINLHLTARKDRIVSFIHDYKEYESLSPMEKYIFCNFDNVCSCIRHSVWEGLPFAETEFAEDIDWSKRALESGYKIVYEPASAVVHSHKGSFLSQYRRSYLHHKRLYELFKVRPVPGWSKVIIFSLVNSLRDAYYVVRNRESLKELFLSLFTLPLSSFLKILGQYKGAKAASENIAGNS
jgi:rhamnosyltransferase